MKKLYSIVYGYTTISYYFRKDPVPGIHIRYKTNIHRKPRTTQEIRNSISYSKYHRSKRKKPLLPTSWDDLMRPFYNKSWKHYRSTQYKVKDIKYVYRKRN